MDARAPDAEELADLFKALASDTRVRMLQLLSGHSLCVGALADRLGISQSAASQHLSVLKAAGLVEADKRGYFVHYVLAEGARARCGAALESALGPASGDPSSEAVCGK